MTWDTTVCDLYVKLVDPTGKNREIVCHHRVWDKNRFLSSLRLRYEQADNEDERREVKVTTVGVYRKFMGYKAEHC